MPKDIDKPDYHTDGYGYVYNFKMSDHTSQAENVVLDAICNYIENSFVYGTQEGNLEWTGWMEVTPGDYAVHIHRDQHPLSTLLNQEALVQHPGNFLCFALTTVAATGANHITVNHFGPFGWTKEINSQVTAAWDTAGKIWEEERAQRIAALPKQNHGKMPRWPKKGKK